MSATTSSASARAALLTDIERQLAHYATGRYSASYAMRWLERGAIPSPNPLPASGERANAAAMGKIADILKTMEYGPSPEAADAVRGVAQGP